MNDDDTEMLSQFFGGWFHQDWDYDASSDDEILDRYKDAYPRPHREKLATLIEEFSSTRDDPSLERALVHDFHCYYRPEGSGLSKRSWLAHVSARLRSE